MAQTTVEITVPYSSLRVYRSRQNIKTHRVPPYSSVYGMLLSRIGEIDKFKYRGVEIAIALLSNPSVSKLLRKIRRFKSSDINAENNSTPEYQEILTGLRFIVAIRDANGVDLADKIAESIKHPGNFPRFGALYLGESDNIVTSFVSAKDNYPELSWVVKSEMGDYYLPHWIDHSNTKPSSMFHSVYDLVYSTSTTPPDDAWVAISDQPRLLCQSPK